MRYFRKMLIGLLLVLLLFLGQPLDAVHTLVPAVNTKAAAAGKMKLRKTKLSKTKLSLVYGKTAKLVLKNAPAKVAWFSGNQKIAYCNKGTVEARAVGKTAITAKCSGRKYRCTVTVTSGESSKLKEDGHYTSKKMVANYIHTYQHLPGNFITKEEAVALGWPGGSLIPYQRDACIGGNVYTDYENDLEAAPGRVYYECDIDTMGALERGGRRLVFSDDGVIYYTKNHYNSFERLY